MVGASSDQSFALPQKPLVFGNEFAAVIAEFGFLQQLPVEVVFVGRATTVEASLVIELVMLAALVFDVSEQQTRIVVAVAQLAAVRIDTAADQVQVVGVFVAGYTAEFVPFGGDVAIGVVGEGTCCAARQRDLCQTVGRIPLVLGDGAGFFLAGDLTTQCVVAILTLAAVWQAFFRKKGMDLFLKKAARTGGIFTPF
ncbi:hypothetical protein GCM10009103_50390 [Pseudomonas koreensis]|nr:hypothetical protein GCM10009103_50390 [Pseudomonas koreensis]